MQKSSRFAVVVFVLCSFSLMVPGLVYGQSPFGSYEGGPDVINLSNLNSHVTVPVLKRSGRGPGFNFYLTYDSSVWQPVLSGASQVWQPIDSWGWNGSDLKLGYLSRSMTSQAIVCGAKPNQGHGTIVTYRWSYVDGYGVTHFFGSTTHKAGTCGTLDTSLSVTTNDGSGYSISVVGATLGSLYGPDGRSLGGIPLNPSHLVSGAGTLTDRNGNQITVDSSGHFFDTLSSSVPALTQAGTGSASSPTTFSYTAPSGATATLIVKYTTQNIQTNFACAGVTDYGTSGTSTADLVSEIDLPDGSKYLFAYEPTVGHAGYVTGRILSIQFPTGGTVTYSYTGANNGINCTDGSATGLTRQTPDGTWTYTRLFGSGSATETTVTAPQLSYDSTGNQRIIQFQGPYETQRNTYQGSAPSITTLPISEASLQTLNLLGEIQTCYGTSTGPCPTTAVTLPITQRTITNIISSGSPKQTSQHIYKYSAGGTLTEQDDYDFGAGAPGGLLKKTSITYPSLGNIKASRQTVTVTNGVGATVSKINYNYDETAVVATTGTPQLIAVTSSRGNLTSVNYYTNGTTFLTKSITNFDTGSPKTVTDINGSQTTYTYGACGNSFPTSVAEPLSLSRSMTWNCVGAVNTSVVDENSQTSTISYTTDPSFWRPESSTDAMGATTNYVYTGHNQTESVLTIVSGSSADDTLSTRDSLGRPLLKQKRQGPASTSFDSVEQVYDATGNSYKTTIAFTSTAGTPVPATLGKTVQRDALGRATLTTDSGGGTETRTYSQNDVLVVNGPTPTGESSKQRQLEYDGLGRLKSVCEITSGTGSGTCSQSSAKTGFWTKYSYDALGRLLGVIQNAQATSGTQSRTYLRDLLGRITSEIHPEDGTTTYVYDSDATCGTSNGDVVKKTDAVGNVTCISYDALHRQLSVRYPSGSYATRTPNKYFVYDTATVNSTTMLNGKGHLVEAYTAPTSTGTKITDIGISYTARGEPSDAYEWTTNSGGYYHVAEQFWANGMLKNAALIGITSLPSFTTALDAEGRMSQVSASSGQNPLTGATYNVASLPTSQTFGSGDSDAFGYDPNTFRMTQYKFNINGASLIGNLTWNALGTLQNLNISDPFDAADTQSCAYLYDEQDRLASANCGSIWAQTFSYDVFGNIAKSGSASFAAIYNSANNHITSVAGFFPTYDANGNTLTDPTYTYSWDSAGKPVSINSIGLTYDALGRMAEQNRSGVFTQFVYGSDGRKFAIMNGQTLQKALVPLLGGAVALYGPSGLLAYEHSDHLGSIKLASSTTRSVTFVSAYAPFGEAYAISGTPDLTFTGQRGDVTAGLFDFPTREYSDEGRWHSPDPSGLAAASLADPQTLNRYAYVRGTPLSLVDRTGLGGCAGYEGSVGGDQPGVGYTDADCAPDYPAIYGDEGDDPTSGGDPGNAGDDCKPDDPICGGNNGTTYGDGSGDGDIPPNCQVSDGDVNCTDLTGQCFNSSGAIPCQNDAPAPCVDILGPVACQASDLTADVLHVDEPNDGVHFTVPIDGIGGLGAQAAVVAPFLEIEQQSIKAANYVNRYSSCVNVYATDTAVVGGISGAITGAILTDGPGAGPAGGAGFLTGGIAGGTLGLYRCW